MTAGPGRAVCRGPGMNERTRMGRSVPAGCFCLLLLWGSLACTLKPGDSSALSARGERVSLQVADPIIFFGHGRRSCPCSLRLFQQPDKLGKMPSFLHVCEGVLPWYRIFSSTSSR